MNKLEEALKLMDVIEKNPNNLLNDKVQELLKENDFYLFKEKSGIEFYRKRNKSNGIFIEYNVEYHYDNLKKVGDYCFAVLKESSDKDCNDFSKRFKRHIDHDFLNLGLTPYFMVTCAVGILGLSKIVDSFFDKKDEGLILLFSLLSIGVSLGWAATSTRILKDYLVNQRKIKMEESCKELYYGREALEKAFGGNKNE